MKLAVDLIVNHDKVVGNRKSFFSPVQVFRPLDSRMLEGWHISIPFIADLSQGSDIPKVLDEVGRSTED